MKKVICLFFVFQFLLFCEPVAKLKDFEVIWKGNEIRIPTVDGNTSQTVKIPAFKKEKNKILCMRFKAYLEMESPGGWNPYLLIEMNGKILDEKTEKGEYRLLNRISPLETTIGTKEWFRNGIILTLFGPGDDKVVDERIINYREEGYWYLLNIEDVANFIEIGADERIESAKENEIKFTNKLKSEWIGGKKMDMVIKEIEIGYLPEEIVKKFMKISLENYPEMKVKKEIKMKNYTLKVGEYGGIEIEIDGEKYLILSEFSYPGEKIGYNKFSYNIEGNEKTWIPQITSGIKEIKIKGKGKNYEIERKIRLNENKIEIEDKIENIINEDTGVIINHKILNPEIPSDYRICGIKTEVLQGIAENPSIYLLFKKTGIGFICEDNISRLQGEAKRKANSFIYSIKHFAIGKGKKYTFKYSIYPQKEGNYWTFINKVRNDWDVNYTIDGPFVFSSKIIPERKTKIYSIGPWLDYYNVDPQTKSVYTREKYKESVLPQLKNIKESQADAKVIGKLETNLITIYTKDIKDGEKLPKASRTEGKYGYILNEEQSKILKEYIKEWMDSVLMTEDGRLIVDTYYPGYLGPDYIDLLVYPEVGNYRFKKFIEQIDFLMNEVGMDGVYIDQYTLSWGPIGRMDRHTYEKWDGYTVDIDEKTGKITRKYTDCGLVGAEARKKIIEHVLSKGGIVVINSFPSTNEEQKLHAYRFAEFENENIDLVSFLDKKPPENIWCTKGHLSSPIILGVRPQRFRDYDKYWAEIIMKAVITGLRNGVLYYYYGSEIPKEKGEYGPINHMFPFTPVEINEGYLIGKERIITCISKKFEVKSKTKPVIHVFDLKGKEKDVKIEPVKKGNNWIIDIKINDWNEISVIEF